MRLNVEAIKQYACILDQRVPHHDEVSSKSYLFVRKFELIVQKRLFKGTYGFKLNWFLRAISLVVPPFKLDDV